MEDIVIVAAARTAVGKFGGTLAKTSAPELGAVVIADLLKRSGLAAGGAEVQVGDPDRTNLQRVGPGGLSGLAGGGLGKRGTERRSCARGTARRATPFAPGPEVERSPLHGPRCSGPVVTAA